MIQVTHRPGPIGWEFCCDVGGVQGGGRSLQASIDTSEHAVRHYLSQLTGCSVCAEQARARTRHVCLGQSDGIGGVRAAACWADPMIVS